MSNGNTNNTVFIQKLFTSRDNFVDGNVQQATANAANYVGQEGRIWWNPDLNGLYYSDGNTPGGFLIGYGGNGSPGGPINSIQVNDGAGNFSGSANFVFNGDYVDLIGDLYTGNVYANYFIGDGSQLTGLATNKIFNGTSYANIENPNGNLEVNINTNSWVFDDTGNLTAPGTILLTGVTDANISSSSNINIISNSNAWNFDTDGNLTLPGNGEVSINYANGSPYGLAGIPAGNNLDIQFNDNGNFGGTDDFTFDSVNVVVTVNGNIVSNNFVANNDYFFSNGDTVLDQVIDYYSNVNTGDIIAGNITVTSTANLGNFTISDQTLAGTITDRPISISPVGNATVKILNGIEVFQGSFTSNPLFSISNSGVVSTLVPNAVSYLGAFEIIGNPDGDTVPPQNYGVMLHSTGSQSTPSRIYNDGVNAYGAIINRRYNGTSTAPTGVLADQIIARYGGTPYLQSSEWPQYSTVRLDFVSTEVQTTTNQGTQAQLWATPNGSNVPLIVAQFDPGEVLITGNIIPNSTTSQYGLGNATNKWGNLYLGPDSLFMEDTTLGTNAELTVDNGILLINGTQRIQIGNMQMTSSGIQKITGASAEDLTIGTTGGGNTFVRNFGIKFKDNSIQETAAIPLAQKGAALGVVPLNGATKIDTIYLPAGGLNYQGIWNASTNTPALADGVGTAGDQWIVGTAGTQNLGSGPITFALGDFAILNDSLIWQDVPVGGTGVTSWGVTGNYRAGIVTMVSSDVTTALNSGAITNAKLQNANITINTGFGLSGGGVVDLGNSLTLTTNVGNIIGGTGVTVSSSSGNYTINIGQPVATTDSVQFLAVSASTTIQATGNVSGGNVTTGGQVVATGNVTGSNLKASSQVLATGNVIGNNIIANIGLFSTGDPVTGNGALQAGVSGHTITSNTIAQFIGNTPTYAQVNFENLNANGSSDYVATADNGNDSTYFIDMGMNGSNFSDPAYTIFAKNDGYLYTVGSSATGPGTAGNLVIGSTSGVVKVFTGNTLTANLRTTTSSSGFDVIGKITATGNIETTGNLKTANTVINSSITSNGNVNFTGANISLGVVSNIVITGGTNGQFLTTNGSGVLSWSNVAGANVTGAVPYATTANSVAGANVSGQVGNALIAGTVYTNAQPNITSVGTLSGLTSTGIVNFTNTSNTALGAVGNVHITGGTSGQFLITDGTGNISWSNVSAANITGTIANANYAAYAGNVTIAGQGNITSLGTLTGLTSTGVVNFTTASNVALGSNANIHITGGNPGETLVTDGAGNLTWATPQGANTIIQSGANTTVNVDFTYESLHLVYLPTGPVTINLSNYAAGHTGRVLVRYGTPYTLNTGIANAQQSTDGTIIIPITGAGGHKITGNQTVQLVYTCFDSTAANCYVATTFL